MFPKKGNYFPNGNGTGGANVGYAEAIARALQAELGNSHRAVKTVMRWTGANERTVKNWLAAKGGPRGEHLMSLIRHSNAILDTVLQLAGREPVLAANLVRDARDTLARMLALADTALAEQEKPNIDREGSGRKG